MSTIGLVSVLLAVPALWCATIFGVKFFWTRQERLGKLNDLFSAIAVLLLIPGVLALRQLVGATAPDWFLTFSLIAAAGLALAGLGQLLLIARVIPLNASFMTGGLGFLPFLAWLAILAGLSIRSALVAPLVGWITVGLLASMVVLPVLWAAGKKQRALQLTGIGIFLLAASAWFVAFAAVLRT
jgi:hypothetical protein